MKSMLYVRKVPGICASSLHVSEESALAARAGARRVTACISDLLIARAASQLEATLVPGILDFIEENPSDIDIEVVGDLGTQSGAWKAMQSYGDYFRNVMSVLLCTTSE